MFPLAPTDARNWRSAPWVCVAFFLVYLALLLTYQFDESDKQQALATWYQKSGQYQLEYPNYISFLRISARVPEAEVLEAAHTAGNYLKVVEAMAFDPSFETENLERGGQYWDFQQFDRWRTNRAELETRAWEIPRYRFGLVPSAPRPATYLTWHFLQDSIVQWLVALLAIVLFAWPTEARLGLRRMAILWVLTGVITGMLYVAFMSSSFVPLVGATPMAAMVMGAFLSLYLFERLDFVYFHPKAREVRTLSLPAIVLAPLWFALPIYEYFGGSAAPHVWLAQLAGLLAGAIMVQLAQRRDIAGVEAEEKAQQETDDETFVRRQLTSGWASMSALDFVSARESFTKVLDKEEDSFDALSGLYQVEKLKPDSGAFHDVARRLLRHWSDDMDEMRQQYFVYKDYIKRLADLDDLDMDLAILMVLRLIRLEDMREAEKLSANVMERKQPHDLLERMFNELAEAHDRFGNAGKANHFRGLAERAAEAKPSAA